MTQPTCELVQTLINEVLEESGRDPIASFDSNARLRNDLGLDSLDLAVLTVKLEANTGVDVFRDGLVHTVSEVIAKIDE